MVGGLVIGLAEAFFTGYVPGSYTPFVDVFVFSLLILLLLVRPSGLLGKADLQKV
jgi:branched-chain amino acid transport system permease protein